MSDNIENKITIEIDGTNYEDFLSADVSRRFDEFCGTFDFKCTKADADDFNIDNNSYCDIYVNDKKVMTGVIDKVSPSDDANSSDVNITGRDITCDIVDSCIPTSISLSGEFDLVTVVEKVVEALGLSDKISVINEIPDLKPFTSADIVSAEVDKNAFEFMNEYAQKVSAILITNEDGNIVITRAGESSKTVPDKILNIVDPEGNGGDDNNVLSSSAEYDFSQRYYKYIVVSQGNANTEKNKISIENVSQKGEAIDEEVRQSRVLVIKADNACNSATCEEIATLECNVRRANSLKYSCTVAGYMLNDGNPYSINTIMQVIDDDNFINSELLVKGVTFSFGDGSVTGLEFAVKDAYTLQANLDEIDARTNKTDNKKKKSGGKKSSGGKKGDKPIVLTPAQQKDLNNALGM